MGISILTFPVSTTDWRNVELGTGDGSTDGGGNLRGTLHPKTNVAISVSKGNESLETGTLSCRTLLRNRHDLHDLVVEFILEEEVNNLG